MQRHQLFHFFSFTLLPLKSEAAGTKQSINLLPVVLVTDIVTVCLQKQTFPISKNNNTAQTVWGDYCVKTPTACLDKTRNHRNYSTLKRIPEPTDYWSQHSNPVAN